MRLYFSCEGRFIKKDGRIYSKNSGFTNKIWDRYLQIYETIVVFARVFEDNNYEVNENYLASSERVSFVELPYYVGPSQFLRKRGEMIRVISQNISNDSVYICRVPGRIGSLVASALRSRNIGYGVEIVGDPWDVFSKGSVNHPLRLLFKYSGYYRLKSIVKHTEAALYVTKETLQKRYPVNNGCFSVSASNVQIDIENMPEKSHIWTKKDTYELISVGSLEQMYKAPDIVLRSLHILKKNGLNVHLVWLGDGKFRPDIETLATTLGITDMVSFKGNVTASDVKMYLSRSDIFMLVSRTEGLPRAVVEAMAMGLPCIGSNVGGIPELLNPDVIVPKEDAESLAKKIGELITNSDFYNDEAARNLEEAKGYDSELLREKRVSFYRYLEEKKSLS